MITLKNVKKVFKSNKNKISAIDDTTLSFDNNGLVALLGPSGCGKTTLLNAIGGLDKIDKGQIYINDKLYKSMSDIDKIRSLNIGYIFQDYKLVKNLSVYDNVAIVLKIMGIKDKTEIKQRVEYVLEKVGMLRYKKRPCFMLSGGEQQRVSIARALVKNPDIILADEPTGNLDSKNSLEIMKIISSISKTRLIILVTHEQNLAKFYSNRIIEIKDGKVINDYLNSHNDSLDYEIDNNIYLKDYKLSQVKNDVYDINLYNNSDNIKMDIVIRNGNIYIKSEQKIEVVDEHSSIEFINDNYKKINKEAIEDYNFEVREIENKKYVSIFNVLNIFTNGFKKVFKFSLIKKILLAGFFFAAMFIMFSISSMFGIFTHADSEFIEHDRNYVIVDTVNLDKTQYEEYLNIPGVEYIIPGNSQGVFSLKINSIHQINTTIYLGGSITADADLDVIYGNKITSDNEVVVDQMIINALLENAEYINNGILKAEDFIGLQLYDNILNKYTIVGIADTNNPNIYVHKDNINNIINTANLETSYFLDYTKYDIDLVEGRYPNENEIIVNVNNKNNYDFNENIANTEYKVVGYYEGDITAMLTDEFTILKYLVNEHNELSINTSDKEAVVNKIGVNAKDSYEYSKDKYEESLARTTSVILAISLIVLSISLIEIFLMIRSSFLSRVKEVGIYRAIGIKKTDIYKMFLGEIFAITTLVSVPGIIFMAYILINLPYVETIFEVNTFIVTLSIITVYLFNIVIGLLPVYSTMIKTPAYILSRNDVE